MTKFLFTQSSLKGTIVLLFLFYHITSISQDFNFKTTLTDAYYFTPQNLGTISPQAAGFHQYGNLNMDYYNGLFSMEIPLFTYKDRDFEIPLSIKYISNPFVPSQRASVVGYNWILNAGGVITREVYGAPDDNYGRSSPYDSRFYIPDGMLAAKEKFTFRTYSESQLSGFQMDKNGSSPYWRQDFNYDFRPDIFKFTFGGYSGSFIIGNNGTPILLENKGYKIDISGLKAQWNGKDAFPRNSTIKITTPNGYVYEFGGSSSYVEYFFPTTPRYSGIVKSGYITSWFLKSIQAPNGRRIDFIYESVKQESRYHYFARYEAIGYRTTTYPYPSLPNYLPPLYNYSGFSTVPIFPGTDPFSRTGRIDFKDLIHTPLIKTIKIDNATEIAFAYSERFSSFYGDHPTEDKVQCLNSIVCKYNDEVAHRVSFEYLDKGKYSFLHKVRKIAQQGTSTSKEEVHTFSYYLNREAPNPKTISLNHWGGWSGGYETIADAKNYCSNIYTNKAVNPAVYDFGLLQKVTYPTGGYTEIGYEYNRYNRWIEKDMTKIALIKRSAASPKSCSGARVKTIKDYDPVQQKYTHVRTFDYKNPDTNEGSGMISFEPEYVYNGRIKTEYEENLSYQDTSGRTCNFVIKVNDDCSYLTVSSNSYGREQNLSEYPIVYTDVIEKFQDGSSIHYQYSSWDDTPDDMNSPIRQDGTLIGYTKSTSVPIVWTGFDSPSYSYRRTYVTIRSRNDFYQLSQDYGLYIPNDMSRFRGKLLNKIIYSSTGSPVYKETNTYNIAQAKSQYQYSIASVEIGCAANKIYTVPCLLVKQSIEENNLQKEIAYTYNALDFLQSKEMINSDAKDYMKRFKYIGDYSLKNTDIANDRIVIGDMIKNNMINYVVEEQTLLKKNNSWNLLNGRVTRYGNTRVDKMKKPEREYILDPPAPLMDSEESKLANDGTLVFNDKYRERIVYNDYDNYGNPVFVTEKEIYNTVYLWSYKGQYLVAKIENATYDLVSAALGGRIVVNRITNAPILSTSDLALLNGLRSNADLKDTRVTTYTYRPQIGMTSETDPNGITTYYEYDDLGRLKIARDYEGNILKEYKVHYFNE